MISSGVKTRTFVVIISMTVVLVAAVLVMANVAKSAALAPSIADKLPKDLSPIMKIKSFAVKEKRSAGSDLELQARTDGFRVSFDLVNKGIVPAVLKIDRWETRLSTYGWVAPPEIIETNVNTAISSGGSLLIKETDLSKYDAAFEYFPMELFKPMYTLWVIVC